MIKSSEDLNGQSKAFSKVTMSRETWNILTLFSEGEVEGVTSIQHIELREMHNLEEKDDRS